ncbi:MAG: SOS response-associated peptidase [Opitutales bacterium]
MCGRFTLHISKNKLVETLASDMPEGFEYEPDYNISPGREILTLREEILTPMHWGLRTPQNFHVNARLETADSTPRFRESWEEKRCLIPANGFYEWLNDGVRKQPHYIAPADESVLYFAGLWFPSKNDAFAAHCVILTTEAQESLQAIHHRMPVCIPAAAHRDWLNNKTNKADAIQFTNETSLTAHGVSSRVNGSLHHDSSLIRPTTPQGDDQMQFF